MGSIGVLIDGLKNTYSTLIYLFLSFNKPSVSMAIFVERV